MGGSKCPFCLIFQVRWRTVVSNLSELWVRPGRSATANPCIVFLSLTILALLRKPAQDILGRQIPYRCRGEFSSDCHITHSHFLFGRPKVGAQCIASLPHCIVFETFLKAVTCFRRYPSRHDTGWDLEFQRQCLTCHSRREKAGGGGVCAWCGSANAITSKKERAPFQ